MKQKVERLLGELRYYSSQLDAIGTVLVDLIRGTKRHPEFIAQVAETYQFLTCDLIDVYNAFKRALRSEGYGLGAAAPKVPIATLEKAFIILRDAAEEADSRASKLSHYKTREARIARETADQITSLAENAAKILVSEAEQEDRWTVEWERELGLRRWLR